MKTDENLFNQEKNEEESPARGDYISSYIN
jgi:hypothetical protein